LSSQGPSRNGIKVSGFSGKHHVIKGDYFIRK
jgi:hypothetical protein